MQLQHADTNKRQRHYVPPVLGNGSLSLMIDREGNMSQETYCGMVPTIVRAGFRYEHPAKKLISYGYFSQELPGETGKMLHFEQTLDIDQAYCKCIASYESGITVTTTVFCHAEKDIVAIRKEFSAPVYFRFHYQLPQEDHLKLSPGKTAEYLNYSTGKNQGTIRLYAPELIFEKTESTVLQCSGTVQKCDLLLCFDNDAEEPGDFDSLFVSHCAVWKKFWSRSSVSIPDEALLKTYRMALYHLKISSTKWSVPTGLFKTHWESRYFAYDEFYTHGAFLTSGHFEEAEKIDRFRANTLTEAIYRACHYTLCPPENHAARFPWETLEDGTEGAPPGFWMDRYVHMANIAFSAWETWYFTQDMELLKNTLYPLIHACAEYHRRSAIYRDSVQGAYIGKCTDMERFGEFIERPYSTTCGVITTFRVAAKCADILNCDQELKLKWVALADELYRNIPEENGKYIPYPGCTQRSIAMYHGIFPYGLIPADDPKQLAAIRDTEENIAEFAGQYFKGSALSSWYAGVIATAEVRMGKPLKALHFLQETANNATGCFYECFEVYEKQKLPWFTTASGAIVRALNELLIHAAENQIDLWNGKPYSFDLPAMKYQFSANKNGAEK